MIEPFELMVYIGEQAFTRSLPSHGRITLGRGANNDVVIDDASVSRQHAALHVDDTLRIEDLGSANGTRIRQAVDSPETADLYGSRLRSNEPLVVTIGQCIQLGSVTLVVRRSVQIESNHDSSTNDRDQGVVVRNRAMVKLHEMATRLAAAPISVLLLGETGVGKEVFAESIHRQSPRAQKPFLKLNCAAFSETLLESEWFGHERGAFTGAAQVKQGLFESADGGTVFLDEVGELPMAAQAKLLRVLEDRQVMRVGALRPRAIDLRIVAATNRDLDECVARGSFRQDLLFRLNGVSLLIPPLRERTEEIADLAMLFARRASTQLDRKKVPTISTEAMGSLQRHAWPGNIRELRNVMDRAVLLSPGDVILTEHLLLPSSSNNTKARVEGGSQRSTDVPSSDSSERDRIVAALTRCGGNQTRAAEELGISRRTLVTRLEEHGITRPRKPSS